jgi:hypothetical protein
VGLDGDGVVPHDAAPDVVAEVDLRNALHGGDVDDEEAGEGQAVPLLTCLVPVERRRGEAPVDAATPLFGTSRLKGGKAFSAIKSIFGMKLAVCCRWGQECFKTQLTSS